MFGSQSGEPGASCTWRDLARGTKQLLAELDEMLKNPTIGVRQFLIFSTIKIHKLFQGGVGGIVGHLLLVITAKEFYQSSSSLASQAVKLNKVFPGLFDNSPGGLAFIKNCPPSAWCMVVAIVSHHVLYTDRSSLCP